MSGMAGEQPAGVGEALDDVEDAVGQAGLGEDLGELERGERRQLGRLEDHGVAAGERRRRLPAGDLERVVPGADAGDDAERLAPGVAEGRRAEVDMLAGERGRDAGESSRGSRRRRWTSTLRRLLDRLAGVARLEPRQFGVPLAQQIGGAPCRMRPRSVPVIAAHFGCAAFAAATARSTSALAGDLDLGEHLAGRRVDRREGLAAGRGDRAAADVVPDARSRASRRATVRRRPASTAARAISPSMKALAIARAVALSVSLGEESVARSQSPSIIAASAMARRARVGLGTSCFSAWRRLESIRCW